MPGYADPGFDTLALHAGAAPDPATGARATPIHLSTSFVFGSSDHAAALFNLERGGHVHSRLSNPTNAVLEQRDALERLSRTDSLTGLGNRHQFNDLFPLMLANAKRQGSPLALVLMDIDLFKRVNDQHGHLTGDACLEVFAERMRQVFRRDNDILLRMGGEEFAVLMPGTDLESAQQMAEQFRTCIADSPLQAREHSLNLTTSLGVGTFEPTRDNSSEAFFQRVDSALFQAKADGRNRLVLAC